MVDRLTIKFNKGLFKNQGTQKGNQTVDFQKRLTMGTKDAPQKLLVASRHESVFLFVFLISYFFLFIS